MLLSLLLISLFLFIFNASHYVQCEHQTKSLGAVMKTRFMCTPAYYVFFIYKIFIFSVFMRIYWTFRFPVFI